ncbi:metallophosphatase [Devosia pacifica]|uniref:Metallophosphatase n=1 Tax=Devosia pacifica TaxID=1335967 RepID=A0A918RYL3_9HYPH|nr:metallophosphoesterase [Devosia pacifica]GHA17463.1 metallophosphatase [Devosia pacifica]
MTLLAHISDIHIAPLPKLHLKDLLSKRLTGYLNWKLTRSGALGGTGLQELVAHLRQQETDFIAVTGDLTNLALDTEISRAGAWLQSIGGAETVCVSPGNHDAYVKGALETAYSEWGSYISGETMETGRFPFVRRIDEVAIISCSSAIPTAPFMAIGEFDKQQADRLSRILSVLKNAGFFRTVLIHHPPNVELQHPSFGLRGHRLFRDVIAEHGAELILHGHTHRSSVHSVDGPNGEVPVIGVASASANQGSPLDDPARYNLFRIERNGTGWSCTMREYGFQRLGSEIVMRLQMRIY